MKFLTNRQMSGRITSLVEVITLNSVEKIHSTATFTQSLQLVGTRTRSSLNSIKYTQLHHDNTVSCSKITLHR